MRAVNKNKDNTREAYIILFKEDLENIFIDNKELYKAGTITKDGPGNGPNTRKGFRDR